MVKHSLLAALVQGETLAVRREDVSIFLVEFVPVEFGEGEKVRLEQDEEEGLHGQRPLALLDDRNEHLGGRKRKLLEGPLQHRRPLEILEAELLGEVLL